MLFVLDSGPLWDLSNPKAAGEALEIQDWSTTRLTIGDQFVVPEIADYEVRRELLRANKQRGIARLNELCNIFWYLALATTMMKEAATLWANARNIGLPTAQDAALDGDVILAAQARNLQAIYDYESVVVITKDVAHLSRYVEAKRWTDI